MENKLKLLRPNKAHVDGGTGAFYYEETLIGCLLIDREAKEMVQIAEIGLAPKHFENERFALSFEAIISQWRQEGKIDPYSVAHRLIDRGVLDRCGGLVELVRIAGEAVSTAMIQGLAERVKEIAHRRECARAAQDLLLASQDGSEAEGVVVSAMEKYCEIGKEMNLKSTVSGKSLLNRCADRVERIKVGTEPDRSILTGYHDLDAILKGIPRGVLIPIAGYTSVGKTAFGLALARSLVDEGLSGLYLSMELPLEQLGNRILAMESGVDLERILHPKRITSQDIDLIVQAQERMYKVNERLKVVHRPRLSTFQAESRMRAALASKISLDFVVLDYLQIMSLVQKKRILTREGEVAFMAEDMRRVAQDLGIVIFALCQVNDEVRRRKTPQIFISDIRESKAVGKHADIVLLIYYSTWEDAHVAQSAMTVEVAKNNLGRCGKCELLFDKPRQRFLNYEPEPPCSILIDD